MPADRILRSRRKTLAIEIRPDGQVWVRAPLRMSQAVIDQFLAAKAGWIEQKIQLVRQRQQEALARSRPEGQQAFYLGEAFTLQPANVRQARLAGQTILIPAASSTDWQLHLARFYQRQAHKLLPGMLGLLAAQHGFAPDKVRISGARTRWGSCSSKGTISLSWRLVSAPLPLIEYVILHELTHLKVHNHSSQFWQALQKLLPDYAERRRQLRAWEKQLTL